MSLSQQSSRPTARAGGRRVAHPLFAVLLTGLATVAATPAPADILPPGHRSVSTFHAIRLDPSVRQRCAIGYRIRAAGETVESIASTELGDRTRAAEIRALNPDLEPALEVGRVLWLPPLDPSASHPLALYTGSGRPTPFAPFRGDVVDDSGRLTDDVSDRALRSQGLLPLRVFAVPLDARAEVDAFSERPTSDAIPAALERARTTAAKLSARHRSVPWTSSVETIVHEQVFTAVTNSGPFLEYVQDHAFDDAGYPLGPWTRLRRILVLCAVAAVGILGLVWVLRRRRRRDPDGAHTPEPA